MGTMETIRDLLFSILPLIVAFLLPTLLIGGLVYFSFNTFIGFIITAIVMIVLIVIFVNCLVVG